MRDGTHVRLCGSLHIGVAGDPIDLGARQSRLVFAYLLLNRERPVPRRELIDLLWPEEAPRNPNAVLRSVLSRVRAAIPGCITIQRVGLELNLPAPVEVDIELAATAVAAGRTALGRGELDAATAHAEEAIALLTSEFLALDDVPWVEECRRAVAALAGEAHECLAEASLLLGGSALRAAERSARRLITAAPFRESGHRLLMRALAAQGDRAEALRVFERLRTLLRDDLGAIPAPETVALHEQLVSAPQRDQGPSRRPLAGLPRPLALAADKRFVGRDRELAALLEIWAVTTPGHRDVVLIAGEAGIGKSSLLANFAAELHAGGAVVLFGHCDEDPLSPYQPFVEAFDRYASATPPDVLRRQLGPRAGELKRLFPHLAHRLSDLPAPLTGDPEGEKYRLFEAVGEFLLGITSEAPVLLVVEDLHWADPATLLLLRHLVRVTAEAPVLFAATHRAADPAAGPELDVALSDLRREHPSQRIDLKGLDPEPVADLIATWLREHPPVELVKTVHASTEGNPFFIEEMLRSLESRDPSRPLSADEIAAIGVPEGVREQVARRVESLGERAKDALLWAAILGRTFGFDVLQLLVEFSGDELSEALDEAERAGLIRETDESFGSYGFTHALFREALYRTVGATRRVLLHRRIAETLEAVDAEPPGGTRVLELGHHWVEAAAAADLAHVVGHVLRAGRLASASLAPEQAVTIYERALAVHRRLGSPDEARCELLIHLGEARWLAGNVGGSKSALFEGASIAHDQGLSAQLARAALAVGGAYTLSDSAGALDEEHLTWLERALAAVDATDELTRARLLARLGDLLMYGPELDRSLALLEEALAIARRGQDEHTLVYVLAPYVIAGWGPDRSPADRVEGAEELRVRAERIGNFRTAAQACNWLFHWNVEGGDIDAALRAQVAHERWGKILREPYRRAWVLCSSVEQALFEGRLSEVRALMEEAGAVAQEAHAAAALQMLAGQLTILRWEQGLIGELVPAIESFTEAHPRISAFRCLLTLAYAETDEMSNSRAILDDLASDGFGQLQRDSLFIGSCVLLTETARLLDEPAFAPRLAALIEPFNERCATVPGFVLGPVARGSGLLAALQGDFDTAQTRLATAERLCGDWRMPTWRARCWYDLAWTLARRGREDDLTRAADFAARAGQEAERFGMAGLARQVEELLAAAEGSAR